uniref:Ig-like domain-containing protein n=1 Tax=Mola mola TaxID=94237 RepID=A0A3Q3XE79_MOLML
MRTAVWFGLVLAAVSAARNVILTKPGQTAIFECPFNKYRSLIWSHENALIVRIEKKTGMTHKGKGGIVDRAKQKNLKGPTLEISGVKDEDAGEFTCNADGELQTYLLFVVSVSVKPSADLQLGSKAQLQCQVKGLMQGPPVKWRNPGGSLQPSELQLDSVARSDAGTWKCMFSHDGLTYNESLEIRVTEPATTTHLPDSSQNSKDFSNPSCVTNPPPLLLGLSWWMWVIIGVGCLVVVLLMVIIICLYRRIKRKRVSKENHRGEGSCGAFPTAAERPQQRRRREKPSPVLLQHHLME